MRLLMKWLGIILGSILGLAVIAALITWIGGGIVAGRTYDIPPSTFATNDKTADKSEGRRIALTLGCVDGCHGEGLGGSVFFDNLWIGTFVAPDLTRTFADLSDAELDSVIRHGVRRNGKSTFIMPSSGLHHLSDEDLNNIAAFIRSQPLGDGPGYAAKPGLIARFFLLIREFQPQAQNILDGAPWMSGSPSRTSPDAGQYLALTACAECHGLDLRGENDFAPSLVAVAAYSLRDFRVLMRSGVAIGNRELELMKEVATGRFVHFTDSEVEALYDYLRSLAGPQ
ncbi:MAG: c-type cytochrome [Woeseiaceae bacterium]